MRNDENAVATKCPQASTDDKAKALVVAILQYAQPKDENIMDQEVRLDIDLAKRILEYASDYTDEGPIDEGWQSSQVARDVAALERAIEVASDASKGKADIP